MNLWLEKNWKFILLLAAMIPVAILNISIIQWIDKDINRLESEQTGIDVLQKISCQWSESFATVDIDESCADRMTLAVDQMNGMQNLRTGKPLDAAFMRSQMANVAELRAQASNNSNYSRAVEVLRNMTTWVIYESALILDEDLASYVLIDLLNGVIWDARRSISVLKTETADTDESLRRASDAVYALIDSGRQIESKLRTLDGSATDWAIPDARPLVAAVGIGFEDQAERDRKGITSEQILQFRNRIDEVNVALAAFEGVLLQRLRTSLDNRLQQVVWEKWSVQLISFACLILSLLIVAFTARAFERLKQREILRLRQLHENEQQLSVQRVQLTESSRLVELGVFAAWISHEIKTPLAVMCGFVEVAKRRAEFIADESIPKSLQKVLDTAGKLNKLLESFRAMSRSDSVSLIEVSTINKILEFPMPLVERRAKMADVAIEIDIMKGDEPFACLPVQLGQVILNLLKNAIDAIENLEHRWIKVSCRVHDSDVLIRITDSGAGIPSEIREKLIKSRFTTKSSGHGTGLGLSISAEICRVHCGSLAIDAQSANTVFVVAFPRFLTVDEFKAHQQQTPIASAAYAS